MGALQGVRSINKFGTNPDVGATYEPVWEHGGTWSRLTAPTFLEVASEDAADTLLGVGARTILVEGLDESGLEVSESFNLNGQTPVLGTQLFSFVNRAYVTAAGSSLTNVGEIAIADDSAVWTTGHPTVMSTVQASLVIGHGQTQQTIYKVPSDKTAFITNGYISADSSKIVTYRFLGISAGNVLTISFEATVTSGSFAKEFNPYMRAASGSIIYVDAKVNTGTAQVSAGLDIILVENEMLNEAVP